MDITFGRWSEGLLELDGATLLWLLIVATLSVHLLCMNVASAGPMICVWLDWRERRDALAGHSGRSLAAWSLGLYLLGMVLGLVLGWLHWSPEYAQHLSRLNSKVYFGGWELLFSLVLMVAHWLWWRWKPATGSALRLVRMFLAFLASTNLLYHFTFLFIVLSDLDSLGRDAPEVIDAAAFRGLMSDPAVYTRALHFILAAFAVAGAAMMAISLRRAIQSQPQETGPDNTAGNSTSERPSTSADNRDAVWGARWALVPTLLQVIVGFWFMTQLPAPALRRLMGGDLVGTVLFGASLLLAFHLMHRLAGVAMGDTDRNSVHRAVSLMVVVVVLMTGTLERALPSRVLYPQPEKPAMTPRAFGFQWGAPRSASSI
ncbi:MAG: hypothetical protein KDA71_05595, partial [Planctomycetales bacterium]|nr:hypothetical protein [Planctomycetales bacterium]